jgi:hypothetical protein
MFTALISGTVEEFCASPRLWPLIWSLLPVYWVMKMCNVKGKTRDELDHIMYMSTVALEKQEHLRQSRVVVWDPLKHKHPLTVHFEKYPENPDDTLCWLGKKCDAAKYATTY